MIQFKEIYIWQIGHAARIWNAIMIVSNDLTELFKCEWEDC
jgi:hypothetical protein